MNPEYLIGKKLNSIKIYPSGPIPEVWKDENTLPTNTWMVFLLLCSGETLKIEPCEISLDDQRYPSLGLSIEQYNEESLSYRWNNETVIEAEDYRESALLLPQIICKIIQSDPLGEGVTSQYSLILDDHSEIRIRHIFPPITIGLDVIHAKSA